MYKKSYSIEYIGKEVYLVILKNLPTQDLHVHILNKFNNFWCRLQDSTQSINYCNKNYRQI